MYILIVIDDKNGVIMVIDNSDIHDFYMKYRIETQNKVLCGYVTTSIISEYEDCKSGGKCT